MTLPSYHRAYRDGSLRRIFLLKLLPVLASFIDSLIGMISPFAVLPRMLGVESAVYNINLRYLKLEMRPSTTLKRVLPANGTVFTDIAEVLRNWIHLSCSTLATDSLELVLHHLPLD